MGYNLRSSKCRRSSNNTSKESDYDGDSNVIGVDRISDLPDSIIFFILSFLPTTSAVATGFLSKSWRPYWTKLTSFDFDSELWSTMRSKCQAGGEGMNFVEFVNTVLIKSTAESFEKFRLRWNPLSLRSVDITTWVSTAITHNIRVLELGTVSRPCWYDDDHDHYNFDLPVALYTCGTLEVLKLGGVINLKVPHSVFLPKLAVLGLNDVIHEWYRHIDTLISGCPVLQSLIIVREHYDDDHQNDVVEVIISSPTLKRLEFYSLDVECECTWNTYDIILKIDTPVLEYLILHDNMSQSILFISELSSITEANLDISLSGSYGKMVVELIQACDHVTYMSIGASTLGSMENIISLPVELSFERLIKLDIEIEPFQLSYAIGLIDCCVKLEVLVVNISEGYEKWESVEVTDHLIQVPGCFGSSLRRVSFAPFHGAEFEMAMVKFILDHGLLLERVDLHHCSDYGRRERSDVLKKVLKLSRGSPPCKISYSKMK